MADVDELRQRWRGRWPYRAADDVLIEIERYAAEFQKDERPQIALLAKQVNEQVSIVRDYLDDSAGLVDLAHRAAHANEGDDGLSIAAAFATRSQPELALVEFYELHNTLMLLQLAAAMPKEELDKLSQLDETPGREIGILDLAADQSGLADLLTVSLVRKRQVKEFADRSNAEKQKERHEREQRWLDEDKRLARENPHLVAKKRRAEIIRERLGEKIRTDEISKSLPKR